METNQITLLDIKEHDFQEAKNALKRYTEQAKEEVELSRVPTDGGLFNLGDHKVTGSELNRITSQIQDYLINFNHLSQGLVDEFGQVYKAFEYLDKDYISGIIASIKAAEKVSIEEQKDRKDIKALVEQHKQSIAVLKKFKADIEKLKHLTDIDKAWELIEKQAKLSKELNNYIAGLSKLKHIKDVDGMYHKLEQVIKNYERVSEQQTRCISDLKSIREYCDALIKIKHLKDVDGMHHELEQVIKNYERVSEQQTRYISDLKSICEYRNALLKIKHLKDVDKLWDNTESVVKNMEGIRKTIEAQSKTISTFDETVRSLQTEQKNFIEKINKSVSEFRDSFDNEVNMLASAQSAKLHEIEKAHTQAVEQLLCEQREKLSVIEKTQNEKYDSAIKEQSLILNRIETTQEETLEQLFENQSARLEQISNEQSANLEKTIKLLEEEKAALHHQVAAITQKVKISYIVAGGVGAITIIQLFLNVLGIL